MTVQQPRARVGAGFSSMATPPKNALFAAHGQWLKGPLPLPGSCFQLLAGDYEMFAQNFCEGGGLKYRNFHVFSGRIRISLAKFVVFATAVANGIIDKLTGELR